MQPLSVARSGPAVHTPVSTAWCGTGTVLVLSDRAGITALATSALQRMGFAVADKNDWHDAIELLREQGESIMAVLIDLSDPNAPVANILTQIESVMPDAHVILAGEGDAPLGIPHDHAALSIVHMLKPYGVSALREKLMQVMDAVP